MMDPKKRLIMKTAMKLFSEKGYYTTSVQEIAKECAMSKGSLYKYFASKEDLYIEVFEFYHNEMIERAARASGETKKEKLKNQIIIQMVDFLEKKDFIEIQFKELQNEKFLNHSKQTQIKMVHWYKVSIEEAFGDDVKPFIWDLIFIHKGMLREFVLLITKGDIHLSVEKLAGFLVERLTDIIAGLQNGASSLLDASVISHYSETAKEVTLDDLFQKLNEAIHQLTINSKKELLDAANLLKKEIESTNSRKFLIDSLFSYLEKEKELLFYIGKIKNFIEAQEV